MSVTLRSSSSGSANSSNVTAALPAGSAVDDLCVLFIGGGYGLNFIDGANWTIVDSNKGSNFNGATAYAVLVQADIDAGSVTFHMDDGYFLCWSIATFVGAARSRGVTSERHGSGSLSITLASPSTVKAGDTLLLFGSNRDVSTNTVNQGTTLQSLSAGQASCVLNAFTATADGVDNATFSYTATDGGNYQAIFVAYSDSVAAVSRLTLGTAISFADDQEQLSRLTVGTLGALIESNEQISRMTMGSVAALIENNEQLTRLTLGVLISLEPDRQFSQAMMGTF